MKQNKQNNENFALLIEENKKTTKALEFSVRESNLWKKRSIIILPLQQEILRTNS